MLPVFGERIAEHDGGVWRTVAPAPMKRTEVAAATVAGKIYVVGGLEQPSLGNVLNFAITPTVEEYDPAVDRWTTKASMPVGLHHVGIGVVGGRLYIIGGYKQSGLSVWGPVATVYAYDPATESWSECAPMPTARGALSVTVHDGKLYAIGGYEGRANSAAVEAYDPVRNSWSVRAPLPTPRDHLAGRRRLENCTPSAEDSKGTTIATSRSPKFTILSRISGARRPICRPPAAVSPRRKPAAAFTCSAGRAWTGTFRENEVYDPARDSWLAMAPMPTAFHGLGSAVVDGRIHVISGGPTPGGSFSGI